MLCKSLINLRGVGGLSEPGQDLVLCLKLEVVLSDHRESFSTLDRSAEQRAGAYSCP